MLKELIPARTKRGLLKLFLLHPDEEFYLRQITKLLNENPRTVQLQLRSLERMGLIESRKSGAVRYYKIRRNFPLFEELRSIILKTEGLKDVLEKHLSQIGEIKYAFVYGSMAKGKDNVYSDVDLFVVGNVKEDALFKAVKKVEARLNREVNYNLMNEKEFERRLKEKDRFLIRVLKSKKIEIIGNVPKI